MTQETPEEISYKASKDDSVQTFGGEAWLTDDYYMNDYGISVGDASITGLTSEMACKLAVDLVNHLIVNGYQFEMVKNNDQDHNTEFKLK